MSLLDRLRGRTTDVVMVEDAPATPARTSGQLALDRYRETLRGSPAAIEDRHEQAFVSLRPADRARIHGALLVHALPEDRPAADDARSLAASAARCESRHPGAIERLLAGIDPALLLAVARAVGR